MTTVVSEAHYPEPRPPKTSKLTVRDLPLRERLAFMIARTDSISEGYQYNSDLTPDEWMLWDDGDKADFLQLADEILREVRA